MRRLFPHNQNPYTDVTIQQIGVHEALLCVLLVLELLCCSTKLTFVLILITWCVFHVFGGSTSVCYRTYKYWVRVCLLRFYVVIEQRTRWTPHGFISEHIVITEIDPEAWILNTRFYQFAGDMLVLNSINKLHVPCRNLLIWVPDQ